MPSSSPCDDPRGKHWFGIHSSRPGNFVVMQCRWTLCQKFKVMAHEDIVAMVAR